MPIVLNLWYDVSTTLCNNMCFHVSAEVGGLMGLCLGASLLTVAELLEFLILAGLDFLKIKQRPRSVSRISIKPTQVDPMKT